MRFNRRFVLFGLVIVCMGLGLNSAEAGKRYRGSFKTTRIHPCAMTDSPNATQMYGGIDWKEGGARLIMGFEFPGLEEYGLQWFRGEVELGLSEEAENGAVESYHVEFIPVSYRDFEAIPASQKRFSSCRQDRVTGLVQLDGPSLAFDGDQDLGYETVTLQTVKLGFHLDFPKVKGVLPEGVFTELSAGHAVRWYTLEEHFWRRDLHRTSGYELNTAFRLGRNLQEPGEKGPQRVMAAIEGDGQHELFWKIYGQLDCALNNRCQIQTQVGRRGFEFADLMNNHIRWYLAAQIKLRLHTDSD